MRREKTQQRHAVDLAKLETEQSRDEGGDILEPELGRRRRVTSDHKQPLK
ncbi:MAG: hypothetical protein HC897_04420 [Thermoanaerobaculia bacterium]|nr:hypothetical protein [Thermoanaerobaculia bacterium]